MLSPNSRRSHAQCYFVRHSTSTIGTCSQVCGHIHTCSWTSLPYITITSTFASTFTSTWRHSRDECSQAFPVFCHSSASVYYTECELKNKNRGGLGTWLCLSWFTVAMHALTWVIFAPGFFHADTALWQVALCQQQAGHGTSHPGHFVFMKYSNMLI